MDVAAATRRIAGVQTYGNPGPSTPLLVLAHGAGAGEDHPWVRNVGGGLASRGVSVTTFNFPYRDAGRKVPDRGPVLEAAYREVWTGVRNSAGGAAMFAGGKSMGGRIATQVASTGGFQPGLAGIVCFGYPLHPPAKPEVRRDSHLAAIDVPLLLVHGTRDPFGTPDEMTELAGRLRTVTLSMVEGGDHSLQTSRRADVAGPSFERVLDEAARWIRARAGLD